MLQESNAKSILAFLLTLISKAPGFEGYVNGYTSTLGGAQRTSILLTISIESKDLWRNGIIENSHYSKFIFSHTGELELISGYGMPKFRKIRVVLPETTFAPDIAEKIALQLSTKLVAWIQQGIQERTQDDALAYRKYGRGPRTFVKTVEHVSPQITSYVGQISKDTEPLNEAAVSVGDYMVLVKIGANDSDFVVHEYPHGSQYDAETDFKIMVGARVMLVKVVKAK